MKNSTVRITEETERAVIDKAWRDHRIRSWQGAMDLAIKQFLEETPATGAPPGMRAIYVPAELPDDLAGLLQRAGREMVDDLARGLDTAAMAIKKTKLARMK